MTEFEPIVIERGRTHDETFEEWANKVQSKSRGEKVSLKDYKRDTVIELLNEAEQVAMRFQVYRCWPSAYTAVGELDASASEMAIESITLQHEGWERDRGTGEPSEPTYSNSEG